MKKYKKAYIALLAIVIIIIASICLTAYIDYNKKMRLDNVQELIGMNYKDVYSLLGEPQSSMSGFWGDAFKLTPEVTMHVYYDSDGNVEMIKLDDMNGSSKVIK